jgi:predicted Zn-dependent peptidase
MDCPSLLIHVTFLKIHFVLNSGGIMRWFTLFLISSLWVIGAEDAFVSALLKEFQAKLTVKVLDNGLSVLIYEKHDAPIVSTSIGFKVGSVDEHAGNFGCAHMLEHMLFKGTQVYGTKDYEREKKITEKILRWAGRLDAERLKENPDPTAIKLYKKWIAKLVKHLNGVIEKSPYSPIYASHGAKGVNAYTNTDNTVYIVDLPANKLELWALLESQRFKAPVLRSYFPERDVVQEERRMRTDSNPKGKLWEAFMGASYMAHNYRNPVIGYMSELETLEKGTLSQFFKDYYAPNNCTIVLVGDLNPEETFELIEKYFGSWRPSSRLARTHIREPKQQGERVVEIQDKSQPYVYAGYHIPRLKGQEGSALTLLAQILSEGKSSRFYRHIVEDAQLASSVWAYAGAGGMRYPGVFLTGGSPRHPHGPDALVSAMSEVIKELVSSGVSEDELDRAKTKMKADLIYSLESGSRLRSLLLSNHVNLGDWREIFLDLERILQLKSEDLVKVAKRYLISRNRTVAKLLNSREGK